MGFDIENRIAKILTDELCYCYCDNCEFGNWDKYQDTRCDNCYRKYQNWQLSEDTAKELAKQIIGEINKENQIQECKSKRLLDELSKMSPMVIATAYLHAINYTLYGEDVTKKWLTAIQNANALEKAYRKGYYDALQRQPESETKECRL